MAKKSPQLYSISKTFVWFAIVSFALLGSLVAIVVTDYSREWKTWQKKFVQLKIQKGQKELGAAAAKLDKAKLETLKKQQASAETAFNAHKKDFEILRKGLEGLDARLTKAMAHYQDLKQFQDSYKYFYEEYARHHDNRTAAYDKKLKAIGPRVVEAKRAVEKLENEKEGKTAQLEEYQAKQKTLQKQADELVDGYARIEARLKTLKPSLAKDVLNAPMLDFLAPTLKVQQIVLDDLYDDYHFAKTQKVDRCITCHLGIDQKGFEDAPQPFKTHPKLELYLGASSAHPVEKFGCTVCHSGSGHSVSFKDSAHTPRNESQAKEWEKKYQWRELEKWEAKMLPAQYIQAACAKCHHGAVEVPQADKLNRGRKIAETQGCFNCHKIQGFEGRWQVGPALENVGSKLEQDWMLRWLHDPTAFRPSTKMPRIFHLSNTSAPDDVDKDDAAIAGIVAYLIKNSGAVALNAPPVQGEIARGEKLVKDLGCLGCHSAAGVKAGDFAPELSGLGSKVRADWLYTWLKNPKHYSPHTRMPDLRLSDQEAADITAYLISLRNEGFEKRPLPPVKPQVVDDMILASLQGTLRRSEAETALAAMGTEEKMLYLGKKAIAHQGCFSCHAIKGFDAMKPIGADLSNEGRKDIHQLDFGFTSIERSRHAFIEQKFKDPRIFDQGKLKDYYDKLRMPQFRFDDEEMEALTTFVLSLTEEQIPLGMQKRLDLNERQIEKGRLLTAKLNCTGCHTLDGKEGLLRQMAEDPGAAPPTLDGEGAKTQEKWLHAFLHHPSTIRPWLSTRMPTFHFNEEELTTLVEYFTYLAHEDISYKGLDLPPTSPEKLAAGKELFEKLQCIKCHQVNASSSAMGVSFLAPDLTLTKQRLKPDWAEEWIKDPQALQPGTMMPAFFPDGETPVPDILGGKAQEQIQAIRDYLYTYETAPQES